MIRKTTKKEKMINYLNTLTEEYKMLSRVNLVNHDNPGQLTGEKVFLAYLL